MSLLKKLKVILMILIFLISLILPYSAKCIEQNVKANPNIIYPEVYEEEVIYQRITFQEYDDENGTWIDSLEYKTIYKTLRFTNGYKVTIVTTYSDPYEGDGLEREKIETYYYKTY